MVEKMEINLFQNKLQFIIKDDAFGNKTLIVTFETPVQIKTIKLANYNF